MAEARPVTLVVTCDEEKQPSGCTVYFEPEGSDHHLSPGDHFRIEVPLPPSETIDIMCHGNGGLSVVAPEYWGTRAFRKDGSELKL